MQWVVISRIQIVRDPKAPATRSNSPSCFAGGEVPLLVQSDTIFNEPCSLLQEPIFISRWRVLHSHFGRLLQSAAGVLAKDPRPVVFPDLSCQDQPKRGRGALAATKTWTKNREYYQHPGKWPPGGHLTNHLPAIAGLLLL